MKEALNEMRMTSAYSATAICTMAALLHKSPCGIVSRDYVGKQQFRDKETGT